MHSGSWSPQLPPESNYSIVKQPFPKNNNVEYSLCCIFSLICNSVLLSSSPNLFQNIASSGVHEFPLTNVYPNSPLDFLKVATYCPTDHENRLVYMRFVVKRLGSIIIAFWKVTKFTRRWQSSISLAIGLLALQAIGIGSTLDSSEI